MRKYLIVLEKTKTGFSVFSPDIEGCIATGKTKRAVLKAMREAIEFHLAGLREEGIKLPVSRSSTEYLEVRAA